MKFPILLDEKVSARDFIVKYTVRDFIIGILMYVPSSIGIGLRLLLYRFFLKHAGKGLAVKDMVVMKFPDRISIGDHVSIGEMSCLNADGGIEIGDYARIGPRVHILTTERVWEDRNTPMKFQGIYHKPVKIGRDVFIGSGAVIIGGVTVGDGAVIGAGAVVNQDVAPFTVVAGVPAKVINIRGKKSSKRKK